MEELQDALEDAQYVNAINIHESPRPIKKWPVPSLETMNEWKGDLTQLWEHSPKKKAMNEPFSFFWVLSSPVGFFMFSSYVKETTREYLQFNFVEDVLRWRKRAGNERKDALREILEKYLIPCSIHQETNQLCLPDMTLIDEYVLMYQPVGTILSAEMLATYVEQNINPTSEKACSIGLDGRVRKGILSIRSGKCSYTICKLKTSKNLDQNGDSIEEADTTIASKNEAKEPGKDQVETEELDGSHVQESAVFTEETDTEVIEKNRRLIFPSPEDDIFNVAIQVILESIRLKHWGNFVHGKTKHWSKLMKLLWNKDRPVVDGDFYLMRVLGRGGFGLVTACKKKTTGKLYAMKVMKKKRIKQKKSRHLAFNERAVLAVVNSPFVISLKYAFETKSDVFLVMDLMIGGDLSFHLNQKGHFSKSECLYYAARIMLGLQALHDRKFVYRDLKPENCLLADDGRVRLTDLGLTTKIHKNLNGAAGTRGYWAPEMLKKDGSGKRCTYDQRVDWFSFGCVVAEMISGSNPFRSKAAVKYGRRFLGTDSTKEKAVDFATVELVPSFCQKVFEESASDICRQLLTKDPNKRLGASGRKEIMRHAWFNDIDWDMIISDREEPPFIPARDINAASQSEIGNFERSGVKLDKTDESYKGWAWVNPNVFEEEVIEMLKYERDTGEASVPISDFSSSCCIIL